MFRTLVLVSIACATCPLAAFAVDGPTNAVPELKPLSNYVGEWGIAFTSANQQNLKGKVTAKWILDGRYVEQAIDLKSTDGTTALKLKSLMTYDTRAKTYRQWSFYSNGMTIDAEGTWDEAKKTMTSIHRDGGMTTTITADFSQADTERWKIVTRNAQNSVVSELSGTNTRRQKKAD